MTTRERDWPPPPNPSDTYREPAPDDGPPTYPRWPALIGLGVVARWCWRGRSWVNVGRGALRWTLIVLAFVLTPFVVIVHALRHLGGADPEREDIPRLVADGFTTDGGPAEFVAAVFGTIVTAVALVVAARYLLGGGA